MNSADQFEAIVSEHYEPLFRFALSLTRSETDARDLTQHTFYVWAKKGHQLRDISKVKTWLFTTLHRAFIEVRRRQVRFPHCELEEVSEQLPPNDPAGADRADCSHVLLALAEVDKIYQAAVALFYLEDYSYKEIASILELPVGTVKSRIARGIAQLREFLLSEGLPASSAGNDRSAVTAPDESSASDGPIFPSSRRPAQAADRTVRDAFVQWDLSSIFLRERLGTI